MRSTENLREYVLRTADQKAYDRCNVPRPADEAESDLDGFTRAVCLLRREYRIPELVLNASVPIQDDDRDRAAIIILGNRAGAAPSLAASLLRTASEIARIATEENARIAAEEAQKVDWAAAQSAVHLAQAATVGTPVADLSKIKAAVESKDMPAAQDAAADFGAALRAAGLWGGRQRDALLSLVRALGGEPPADEWRWVGLAGCDWDGVVKALLFAQTNAAPVGKTLWDKINDKDRAGALDLLRADPASFQDAIDGLTEVDEVIGAVVEAAKDPAADYDGLEGRMERVLDRLAADDPRRGRAEVLRDTMKWRACEETARTARIDHAADMPHDLDSYDPRG